MSKFGEALTKTANMTVTANGADAYITTGSSLVDLFGVIGSLREADKNRATALLYSAFGADRLLTMKMIFHARNVRGGLQETRVPLEFLQLLADSHPEVVEKNLKNIPLFGSWKDMYCLDYTKVNDSAYALMKEQFFTDYTSMKNGGQVSLIAKWLHSPNATSKENARLGMKTAHEFELTPSKYKRMLKELREYLKLPEKLMSEHRTSEINLERVASKSMNLNKNHFKRVIPEQFEAYIGEVEDGTKKINSSTMMPSDFICAIKNGKFDSTLQAQWNALPNYIDGENDVLVMVDSSMSMIQHADSLPYYMSLGLGIYFAERNQGYWRNKFMTFSKDPRLVELAEGADLHTKVKSIATINSNTDLAKALYLILNTAVEAELDPSEMVKALVIISDGDYDRDFTQFSTGKESMLQRIKAMFRDQGYELPYIVSWNVNSRTNAYQASKDDAGFQFATGGATSTFKSVLRNLGKSPYEAMLETLNNPMYDCVVV